MWCSEPEHEADRGRPVCLTVAVSEEQNKKRKLVVALRPSADHCIFRTDEGGD